MNKSSNEPKIKRFSTYKEITGKEREQTEPKQKVKPVITDSPYIITRCVDKVIKQIVGIILNKVKKTIPDFEMYWEDIPEEVRFYWSFNLFKTLPFSYDVNIEEAMEYRINELKQCVYGYITGRYNLGFDINGHFIKL